MRAGEAQINLPCAPRTGNQCCFECWSLLESGGRKREWSQSGWERTMFFLGELTSMAYRLQHSTCANSREAKTTPSLPSALSSATKPQTRGTSHWCHTTTSTPDKKGKKEHFNLWNGTIRKAQWDTYFFFSSFQNTELPIYLTILFLSPLQSQCHFSDLSNPCITWSTRFPPVSCWKLP